ncbi:MAG TPA: ABC transporter substrate-binding protein [Anaeromyxobacteraceae bacterium]|nr:ABC transporter substrate-binding protein [Anaeromyxobacteraceae bacterium]
MRSALPAALAAALGTLAAPALAGVRPAPGGELSLALPAAPQETDPARALEPPDLLAARALHATLLEVDASGALVPGLLAEVPAPEAGGRAFRLRLRPGLRFADGTPLGASAVAASLSRLATPGAPHGWLALPIAGADLALEGHAPAPRGIRVLSEREILVTLDLPLPEFPWSLAALPAAVVSAGGAGAGPFRPAGPLAPQDGRIPLLANDLHHRGRPFADRAVLLSRPGRGLAGEIERGEVHLALRPEALAPGSLPLRPSVATYAVLNGRRLGGSADRVRAALAALDRAELARRFVRGPSEPLSSLLPSWIAAPGPAAAPGPSAAAAPAATGVPGPTARPVAILVPSGAPDARAAADRIQVKLFDAGVRASVEEADPARFAARLSAGEHDVALLPVPLLAPRPALAVAQIAWAAGARAEARRALREMAGLSGDEACRAADRIAARLGLVPLFASGLRASAGPALRGVRPLPDGTLDPGDLWLSQRGGAP